MNIEKISSIFSQLQALEKNGLRDTDKYKQLYDEMRSYRDNSLPIQEEPERQDMAPENLQNIMSDSQVYQVQQQILGYKMLIRNMNIPKDVEKNMFTLSKDQWEIEKERLVQRSVKYYNESVEKNEELKKLLSRYNSSKKPSSQQQPQQPAADGNPNQQIEFLSDPAASQYIEKNTYFVDRRKKEIKDLLSSGYLTEEAKVRLQSELKYLENLPFYNKLKNNIMKVFLKNKPNRVFEKVFLDRKFFTRERPSRKHEHKMLEKVENQIKNEQEQRKKIRHREFLQSLYQHQAEFFEYHKRKQKFIKKRGVSFKAHLELIEKNKQEAKDRETKKRVQALKDKDFEAYVKMAYEAKNTRILELLKQTDDFLRQIGAKVKLQKGDNPDDNQDEEIGGAVEDVAVNLKNSDRIYYNITHATKEEVKEQPSILEGGTLKSYQMIGLRWMVSLYNNKLNGILADEMGLGKTIQTIALFCYVIEVKKNFGPFLIVVPLTTLSNWVLEFDKWAPSINKIVYKGPPQTRKNLAQSLKNTKWNVCLTTYEYILKDRLILNKFHWQYIIIDEGHRMKNSRSKFASTLGQQYVSEHRLLLTGTPLQNNLAELWSLLNFLLPKVFNSSDEFEKWFSLALTKFNNEKEAQLTEEEQLLIINRLHQVLRPFLLRRVKKEVESEIPNKVEHVIKIELSYWQKIVYDQIKDNGSLVRDPQGKIQTKALMNLMMQLRKICNHPYLFLEDDYYLNNVTDEIFRASGKFELLDRMIPKLIAAKHRILIFSQMTQLMNVMQLYFDYRGFKHLRLDGATKADERGERVLLFNKENSEYDIFLLSTRAGGLGLNLQTADTVILFDSDWNPQMDLQAQDRAHRIGAKNEVRVYRLVTNTVIEEEILSKAAFKQSLDEVLIQAGMYNEKSTESERRERLEDLLKKKATDSDSEDEIPDDEQLNEILARNEDEFKFYEQLDSERYDKEKLIYKSFKDPRKNEGKFHNYRLLNVDDTPDWVKVDSRVDESKKEYGRGNRVRKQVSYIDDVEEQAKADDAEEFQEGSARAERRTRRTRSQKNMDDDDDKESSTGGKRVLRKRTNLKKNLDIVLSDEDEDGEDGQIGDEEEPEAEDSGSDEDNYHGDDDDEDAAPTKKFRRMKRFKKINDEYPQDKEGEVNNGEEKIENGDANGEANGVINGGMNEENAL